MKFNYFRILVTILASFAAFFAYVCRLNLSLSIEDMTVKRSKSTTIIADIEEPQQTGQSTETATTTQSDKAHTLSANHRYHLIYKLPPMYNEEHSFAEISRGRVILSNKTKVAVMKTVGLESRNTTILIRGLEVNSNVLSIDVDKIPINHISNADSKNNNSDQATSIGTNDNQQQAPLINHEASETTDDDDDGVKIDQVGNLLDWSEQEKNDVLGAFFYGYVFLQIPSARAAEMFGAKSLLLMCGIGTGLCSLIFPFAAKFSDSIVPAQIVRLIMGASQGALFPVCYVILCEWLPKNERSSWLPFPSAFSRIGTIVMNLVLPIIFKAYDWEMVFYISGAVTLAWSLIFLILGSNSPNQSYWISKDELNYIESNKEPRIGTSSSSGKQSDLPASGFSINDPQQVRPKLHKQPSIDWWKIINNRPIQILSLVMFLSDWSNFILLVKLPGFLKPVLEMDLVEVGFWSSVLVAIFFIMYPLSGFLASRIEEQFDSLSSLHVRKIFEAVAHTLQAAGCLLIAFSDDRLLVIIALCMMMVGRATVGGGQCLMPPELSKQYPGTVFAYCNTLANLSGIIGPKITTWLVEDPCEHACWFKFFLYSSIMFAIGGVAFCLFADNQQQDIAAMKSMSPGKKKNKKAAITLSQAQLDYPDDAVIVNADTDDSKQQQQQVGGEIFKMEAFPRVMDDPKSNKN